MVVGAGTSQCTSRCNALYRAHMRIVEQLISKWFLSSRCVYQEARILKIYLIYKLNVAYYLYNILNQGKYPTLRPSLCISYPSNKYVTKNSNEVLLLFPWVEAIRMNFKYQFVEVWLKMPDFIKFQRSYQQFKKASSELYLAHCYYSSLLGPVSQFFFLW